MKQSIKTFIKDNLKSFIVGGIIFSIISVYAAVTFPSSEVSYDNSESGLSSTNLKGAIDELYKRCTATGGDQIIENGKLEKDPYECRYFFTGANPNNYITFNEENDGSAGWRIISVECDGTIKIMKNDSIGEQAWDKTKNSNNWARQADLNKYLNADYYDSLTTLAQNQIVAHDWSIGPVANDNNDLSEQITSENSSKWNGKIAMPTISEYLRTNTNKSQCGTLSLFNSSNSNYRICRNTTWMYNNDIDYWWTLSPLSDNSNTVFTIGLYGGIGPNPAYYTNKVRPALYLSSEVQISGGNGSQSNPYTLS